VASSIPGARTALISLLSDDDGLSGVDISRDGEIFDNRETVLVQNAREIVREHYLGATTARESFVIPVRVEVIQRGKNLEQVEARMWQIMARVERTVMLNNTLSGTTASAEPMGIPEGVQSGPFDDQQVAAAATVRIECFAITQMAA
jgi:hypothetical protein